MIRHKYVAEPLSKVLNLDCQIATIQKGVHHLFMLHISLCSIFHQIHAPKLTPQHHQHSLDHGPQGNRDVDCTYTQHYGLVHYLALVSQTTTLFMISTSQVTSNKKFALDELHY